MPKSQDELTIAHLRAQIAELKERYRHLPDEDLFVVWFFRAYVTDNDTLAVEAVTNGKNDKGLDGVLIDHRTRSVFLLQAKYRSQLGSIPEKRADILEFAEHARTLGEEDEALFRKAFDGADAAVKLKMQEARKLIQSKNYRLWLYYVTLGSVSQTLRREAEAVVSKVDVEARMEILSDRKVMLILRDYLDGVAPPIPMLELEMESGEGVKVNGILDRYDSRGEIESWVFSMRGDAIAEIFELGNIRLFARNIRGFLGGDTPVNKAIVHTLHKEPERFFYYNNGITLLCDQAEKVSMKGRDVLKVTNPQVINGQQTTRTLSSVDRKAAAKASVLVKVIRVPRHINTKSDGFDSLVSSIVAGTNWQNAISQSDLMSNDTIQIALERELRKIGYLYIRKRQSKGEARGAAGCKYLKTISKDELAKAVAGCDLDPVFSRSGKEKLYEETMYSNVFPNSDPNYYLPRYWMNRAVSECSRGYPERGYAKWLVLNHAWTYVSPLVRAPRYAERFRTLCEDRDEDLRHALRVMINRTFADAKQYYTANRGKGSTALDPSTFYRNKRGRDKDFNQFVKKHRKQSEVMLQKLLEQIRKIIHNLDT